MQVKAMHKNGNLKRRPERIALAKRKNDTKYVTEICSQALAIWHFLSTLLIY